VPVVSPGAFNRLTIVLPITTGGDFSPVCGFTALLNDLGTRTTGVIRCDQPPALDLGARGGRRLDTAPAAIFDEALARPAPLFD